MIIKIEREGYPDASFARGSAIDEFQIQKLLTIESESDKQDLTSQERFNLRNTKSKAVLDEFYDWIDEISGKTLPQSLFVKAITYAQNQKKYQTIAKITNKYNLKF